MVLPLAALFGSLLALVFAKDGLRGFVPTLLLLDGVAAVAFVALDRWVGPALARAQSALTARTVELRSQRVRGPPVEPIPDPPRECCGDCTRQGGPFGCGSDECSRLRASIFWTLAGVYPAAVCLALRFGLVGGLVSIPLWFVWRGGSDPAKTESGSQ
jgi:hypothetical protein